MRVASLILCLSLSAISLNSRLPGLASSPQAVLATGKGPRYIGVADFNRDGRPDLAVCNSDDGTISVFLRRPDGDFSPAPGSPFAAGPQPNDLGFGDFDGDGNLDLAVPNHQSPFISIFLGDGKGSFRPAPRSPFKTDTYPHPHGVALGDFNGDGKLDVMSDSWGHNKIEMFLGDGRGNLQLPGKTFPVGKRPYQRLRAADFNKDGRADIVTTNLDDGTVSVLLGNGRGGFRDAPGSPIAAGSAPWSVAISDFNRDGNFDLVTIPYAPDVKSPDAIAATLLLGNGQGGFAPAPGSPLALAGCEGPNLVATGDVNGDSWADIVVACAQNNRMLIFYGSKSGFSRPETREIQTGWGGLAVADLNGDGRTDIIVGNAAQNTITVCWSR